MKYKYLLLLLFSLLFFSCEMKKEILGQTDKGQTDDTTVENQGLLDLELKPEKEADIPVSKGGSTTGSQTVILDVNEFAIDIIDVNGNTVKHYDSYADLKNEGGLLLPAGHYSIRATLGEDVNAGFDKPFYSGTNVCEITPQEVAKVITDCVLSNKKVTFRCSDDFLKKFNDDYSIVIDNKVGALTTQNGEKRTTYLKNTGILQFTVYATMKNGGKTLVYNYDMSKNEDIQQYNNAGGEGDGGDDNEGGDTVAKPTIVGDAGLDISQPIEISGAGNKTVRVNINTPGKLASLVVKITSSTLEALLPAVGLTSEFDICDEGLKETLSKLGLSATKGATSTTFDISSFMPMIAGLGGGDYLFTITATDQLGQKASKTLTVRNLND